MKIIASKYEIAETKLVLKAPFSITPDTFNLMFSLDADGLVHYLSFFLWTNLLSSYTKRFQAYLDFPNGKRKVVFWKWAQ